MGFPTLPSESVSRLLGRQGTAAAAARESLREPQAEPPTSTPQAASRPAPAVAFVDDSEHLDLVDRAQHRYKKASRAVMGAGWADPAEREAAIVQLLDLGRQVGRELITDPIVWRGLIAVFDGLIERFDRGRPERLRARAAGHLEKALDLEELAEEKEDAAENAAQRNMEDRAQRFLDDAQDHRQHAARHRKDAADLIARADEIEQTEARRGNGG